METLRKLVRFDQDRLPLERNGLFRGLVEDELRVIFAFSPGDEDEARAAVRDMLLVLPAARIQQFAAASIAEREAQITAAIRSIGDAG